jgi:hypothetical protein
MFGELFELVALTGAAELRPYGSGREIEHDANFEARVVEVGRRGGCGRGAGVARGWSERRC